MTNTGSTPYAPKQSRLILGIDSEMHAYPQWDTKFFPTLLRCEKDFAWGYFMSPKQTIFGFTTAEPVASYTINYIYEGWLKWKWGHQIRTASLDMLHCLPLPERHPQNLTELAPGETKCWHIHMGQIQSLPDVKSKLSEWAAVPMIECNRYTITSKESISVRGVFDRLDKHRNKRPRHKKSKKPHDRQKRQSVHDLFPPDSKRRV